MLPMLIVDDDIGSCLVMQRMVQRLGLDCDIVYDGQQAIRAVSGKRYSVIFLDSFMPIQNGWETALEIQGLSLSSTENPILIGMVSFDQHSLRKKWETAGIEILLSKPINRIDLAAIINIAVADSLHWLPQSIMNISNASTCNSSSISGQSKYLLS